jgi:hypothetical protein
MSVNIVVACRMMEGQVTVEFKEKWKQTESEHST